jgi:hypothetical protein
MGTPLTTKSEIKILNLKKKKKKKQQQGVCHTLALPFILTSILRQKKIFF